MRDLRDTICAQATPPGEGAIAIVRISGGEVRRLLSEVFCPAHPPLRPRVLSYGWVRDNEENFDEVMAVLLPGPESYTREDVAEIHCHGSESVVARILQLLVKRGARPADPGEFTYRAFLAGRIDLSGAEGVMRMIRADSDRAMKSALRQLEGGTASFVGTARREINDLLSTLAAAIDFPDEVEEQETAETLQASCLEIAERLSSACDEKTGRIEEEGLRVALYGRPNAGKSSLLNALLKEDRAIVTAIPGTTRDTITEKFQISGIPVLLTDTAGLRKTEDEAEAAGVARAEKALAEADVRVLVLDGSQKEYKSDPVGIIPDIIALSKGDLPPAFQTDEIRSLFPGVPIIEISAKTGEGLSMLQNAFTAFVPKSTDGGAVLTGARHIAAARRAVCSLREAAEAFKNGFGTETAAIDLSAALDALGEITGETMNEKVIDGVFEKFCVGK